MVLNIFAFDKNYSQSSACPVFIQPLTESSKSPAALFVRQQKKMLRRQVRSVSSDYYDPAQGRGGSKLKRNTGGLIHSTLWVVIPKLFASQVNSQRHVPHTAKTLCLESSQNNYKKEKRKSHKRRQREHEIARGESSDLNVRRKPVH